MSIFKRNKKIKLEKPEERSCPAFGLSFGELFTGDLSANNLSAFFGATNLIANTLASIPLSVKLVDLDGHETIVGKHPVNLIFHDKYISTISKFTLIKNIIRDIIVNGNAFAYIKRGETGLIIGLRYLDPHSVTIHYNDETDTVYYTCTKLKNKKIYPQDMLHFLLHSKDGVNGISMISYMYNTLKISKASEEAAKNFFESGCNINGILTYQGNISEKSKAEIYAAWNMSHGAGGRSLQVLGGNYTYQPVGTNASDAQLLESRLYNVQEICRYMNISPTLLGDYSHSSYASAEQASLDFLTKTLTPYISVIETEMTRKLFLPEENLKVEFDLNSLLKTDRNSLASYYTTLSNAGVLSINEIRRELGLPEVDGGNEHMIAYNSTESSKISE